MAGKTLLSAEDLNHMFASGDWINLRSTEALIHMVFFKIVFLKLPVNL